MPIAAMLTHLQISLFRLQAPDTRLLLFRLQAPHKGGCYVNNFTNLARAVYVYDFKDIT